MFHFVFQSESHQLANLFDQSFDWVFWIFVSLVVLISFLQLREFFTDPFKFLIILLKFVFPDSDVDGKLTFTHFFFYSVDLILAIEKVLKIAVNLLMGS